MANISEVSQEGNCEPGMFYAGETVFKKRGLNICIQTTPEEIYPQETGAMHLK